MALTPCACADVVVGQFSGTDSGAETSADGSGSSVGGTADGTGEDVFVPPGCFSDDFEDGVLDDNLWNTWLEQDATFEEVGGALRFTPPSFGLFDTGVAGTFRYRFAFESGWARVRLPTPPPSDRPVGLFLGVQNDVDGVAINVGSGDVRISQTLDQGPIYSEDYPTDPYPLWLGMRAEGLTIHFETSEDGQTWSPISSLVLDTPLTDAGAFIMAQSYGDNPSPADVVVDDFEVCIF